VERASHLNGTKKPIGISGLPDPGCERPPSLIPTFGPTRVVPRVHCIALELKVWRELDDVLLFDGLLQHLLLELIHVALEHAVLDGEVPVAVLDGEDVLARVDVIAAMYLFLFCLCWCACVLECLWGKKNKRQVRACRAVTLVLAAVACTRLQASHYNVG